VMDNNSTNINKTNNHLSPKEKLNSDGQQLYQYQQNKQSSLIGLIVDQHCLIFYLGERWLFVLLILVELLTITV
jgi:hypothetical protein